MHAAAILKSFYCVNNKKKRKSNACNKNPWKNSVINSALSEKNYDSTAIKSEW